MMKKILSSLKALIKEPTETSNVDLNEKETHMEHELRIHNILVHNIFIFVTHLQQKFKNQASHELAQGTYFGKLSKDEILQIFRYLPFKDLAM
jgi:hypothetical protein